MENLNRKNKMKPWSNKDREILDRLYLKIMGKPSDYHYEKQKCICRKCIILADFNKN
jgi:hypothetical protein